MEQRAGQDAWLGHFVGRHEPSHDDAAVLDAGQSAEPGIQVSVLAAMSEPALDDKITGLEAAQDLRLGSSEQE